ncbi:MAG: hypothetical protein JXA25_19290 [Anaerolineales bacterium]|nr:hypothetical protein [Anaerolineales bacterium]
MNYDKDKVDDMVLALLFLTSSRDQYAVRAWKGLDIGVMDRLHQKGYISDPQEKKPTLVLSEEGARLSEQYFFEYFGIGEGA